MVSFYSTQPSLRRTRAHGLPESGAHGSNALRAGGSGIEADALTDFKLFAATASRDDQDRETAISRTVGRVSGGTDRRERSLRACLCADIGDALVRQPQAVFDLP